MFLHKFSESKLSYDPTSDPCKPPENVTNGLYEPYKSFYVVDDRIIFSCDPGYDLKLAAENDTEAYCLSGGNWSFEESPTCKLLNAKRKHFNSTLMYLI